MVQFIATSQDFASTAEHAGNRCLQRHRSALGILRRVPHPSQKKAAEVTGRFESDRVGEPV